MILAFTKPMTAVTTMVQLSRVLIVSCPSCFHPIIIQTQQGFFWNGCLNQYSKLTLNIYSYVKIAANENYIFCL